MYQVIDPWDVANNPEKYQQAQEYFGKVSLNAWTCALVKGVGRVPYDPNDSSMKPTTAVDLSIAPLAETGLQYDVTRNMIGQFGEWSKITWPSAKTLGVIEAQTLDGKFAQVEIVPTGETYVKNGETKEKTAIKFIAIYDTEAQCLAAYRAKKGDPAPAPAAVPANQAAWEDLLENDPAPAPAAVSVPGNGSSNDRTVALKFAGPVIGNAVRQAGGDVTKAHELAAKMIADQPIISKHFTIDSPEMIELLTAELSK